MVRQHPGHVGVLVVYEGPVRGHLLQIPRRILAEALALGVLVAIRVRAQVHDLLLAVGIGEHLENFPLHLVVIRRVVMRHPHQGLEHVQDIGVHVLHQQVRAGVVQLRRELLHELLVAAENLRHDLRRPEAAREVVRERVEVDERQLLVLRVVLDEPRQENVAEAEDLPRVFLHLLVVPFFVPAPPLAVLLLLVIIAAQRLFELQHRHRHLEGAEVSQQILELHIWSIDLRTVELRRLQAAMIRKLPEDLLNLSVDLPVLGLLQLRPQLRLLGARLKVRELYF